MLVKHIYLIVFILLSGFGAWQLFENKFNEYSTCSNNLINLEYCKNYLNAGDGIVIKDINDEMPRVSYKIDDTTFTCNLHHVNNDEYFFGKTFNVYYKHNDNNVCVSKEYNDEYIERKDKINNTNILTVVIACFVSMFVSSSILFIIFHLMKFCFYINFNDEIKWCKKQNNNDVGVYNDGMYIPV